MARKGRERLRELVSEPGVLEPVPVLELFGWLGVARVGGRAVLPWREDWLAAQAQGVHAAARPGKDGEEDRFSQALVHLQKSRGATWYGLQEAWKRLEPEGRLILIGGNDLGVKSAVKRLEEEIAQKGKALVIKARGRAVAFSRTDAPGPAVQRPGPVEVILEDRADTWKLASAVGSFSAGKLDRGTRLLLDHLSPRLPAERIFDPGCGIGVLGLSALRGSPGGSALFADAHAWAADAAAANARSLGYSGSSEVVWWDARVEPPPRDRFDLVLINPPFHADRKEVDLGPARAIFRAVEKVLAPGGQALVVANRTLPYEKDLRSWGRVQEIANRDGFKLLEAQR